MWVVTLLATYEIRAMGWEGRKDGCNGAVVTSLVLDVLHCMHEQYERPVSLASTRRRQQTSAWDRQEGGRYQVDDRH